MTVDIVKMPFVAHNLHGPDKDAKRRHKTIEMFLNAAEGGMGAFNELNSGDRAHIKAEAAKRGMDTFISGYNGAVWDPTKIRVGKPRVKKIMQGGYVGADGVATAKKGDDDRRVGPSRYCIYLPCLVLEIGLEFEWDIPHLMARTFTTARWRLPLFKKSVVSLGAGVIEPNGVMSGDMNSKEYIDLPGVQDVAESVPADMGHSKYTQILRWGPHINLYGIVDVNTPSDHDLLKGTIVFYRWPTVGVKKPTPAKPQPKPSVPAPKPQPAPKPKPKLPTPGDSSVNWKKQGAPLAHPWAERSPKWIRSHPKVWKQIVKWQAAYLRRYNAQ